MLIETLLFTLFGLLLGACVWWSWRQRQIAQQQAEMNEKLAALGKTVGAVSHDLSSLVAVLAINIEFARKQPADDARESLADAEKAASSARKLLQAFRGIAATAPLGSTAPLGPGSTEGVLRLSTALLRRAGADIVAQYEGDLLFDGSEVDAMRVIQNLLHNAVREVTALGNGIVRVLLRDGALTVTNPVRDPSLLDDRIYEWGVSNAGSTGSGLAISREVATRLGWTIRHEIEGSQVTFVVERAAPTACAPSPSTTA